MRGKTIIAALIGFLGASVLMISFIMAQQHMQGHGRMHAQMHGDNETLFGAPADPSKAWKIAKGGQIYDNWWIALDRKEPAQTHPAYPKSGKQKGSSTWRCKECHGWDYKGSDGKYSSGSHATGITGIRGAVGQDPETITGLLRSQPHGYTPAMIKDEELMRIAVFVSEGQHDVDTFIDTETGNVSVKGMKEEDLLERGRGIYQTTCAVCHGFEGRRLDFGDRKKSAFIGTEAKKNPWEVLHKIRNSHPGVEMISLRGFPVEESAALLAYTRTLPDK